MRKSLQVIFSMIMTGKTPLLDNHPIQRNNRVGGK